MDVNRLSRGSICTFDSKAPVPQTTGHWTEAGAERQSLGLWEGLGSDQQPRPQEAVPALPAPVHPRQMAAGWPGHHPQTAPCVCTRVRTHTDVHQQTKLELAGDEAELCGR